jgi:antitoxin PrlF
MALAESKITSQGQISVPAEVRRRLGVGPGSTLVWEEEGDQVIVRRAKKYTSMDIHRALFPDGPPKRKSLKEMKEGIRQHFRDEHARGRY